MPPKKPNKPQRNLNRPPLSARRMVVHSRKPAVHQTEYKGIEEALRASEQRFRAIYDQTYEFIGLLNLDGTVLDANQTALSFRGLHLSDVVGKPFWETPWWDVSPELQAKLKTGIVQAAQGQFIRINAQHRGRDGAIDEIDFSLTPITDADGKVIQIIPEGRRITELTRAQDQLRQAHAELEQRVQECTVALHEREALTRAFLDNSATIAWMKDAEGRHVYLSPSYERRFGVRFEDCQGKTDVDLWPKEIAERFRANDQAVLNQNEAMEVIEEVQHPDGSRSWWLNRKFPYQDSSGKRYVGGLGVDITERKRVQEVLRARSAELQITLDTAATGLVRNSRDLRYQWVNVAYAKLIGCPVEDIVGRRLSEVLGAEALAKIRPYIDCVLRGERVEYKAELPVSGRDPRWLHVVYMPDRDASGNVIGWVGSITDITERKQMEAALRTVQARQHLLLTTTPVVLYACRATGDYGATFVSENVMEQLGYKSTDYTDHSDFWVSHIHPDDRPWVLADLAQVFEEGQHTHEYRFLHHDGTYRWLHDELRLLRDQAGAPVELVGFQIDITKRKHAEAALQEKQVELERSQAQLQDLTAKLITAQEAERQRLAWDLHDDITQRLAALAIDLGNLCGRGSDSKESIPEALEPLHARAKQLAIDVQRIAHQLHPPVLDYLGLEEAVREHVEEFAARTGLATQVVARRLPSTIPLAHATCLYRVLQESLQNVSKHANATHVLIRLLKTPQGVGLCVHDDGRGFEQAQETERPRGLGLTSMAERVGLLKGTFRLKTKPGDGTEIHASVPLEPGAASQR